MGQNLSTRNWTAGLSPPMYQGKPFWGYPIFDPQPTVGDGGDDHAAGPHCAPQDHVVQAFRISGYSTSWTSSSMQIEQDTWRPWSSCLRL